MICLDPATTYVVTRPLVSSAAHDSERLIQFYGQPLAPALYLDVIQLYAVTFDDTSFCRRKFLQAHVRW